jgi:hypothetical protein
MNANDSLLRVGPVLRTRELKKDYGQGTGLVRALAGVELEVTPGETGPQQTTSPGWPPDGRRASGRLRLAPSDDR